MNTNPLITFFYSLELLLFISLTISGTNFINDNEMLEWTNVIILEYYNILIYLRCIYFLLRCGIKCDNFSECYNLTITNIILGSMNLIYILLESYVLVRDIENIMSPSPEAKIFRNLLFAKFIIQPICALLCLYI